MSGRPAPSLTLLSAITALAFCGLHMVVPALPLLVAVFADTPAHVQLIVSLYLAGIGAGQLVYGPVSDRFGRRPVLLAGLAAFLVETALCGAAWSLPALIAGRVLQALGACAGIVLSRAMIRDVDMIGLQFLQAPCPRLLSPQLGIRSPPNFGDDDDIPAGESRAPAPAPLSTLPFHRFRQCRSK